MAEMELEERRVVAEISMKKKNDDSDTGLFL